LVCDWFDGFEFEELEVEVFDLCMFDLLM